MALARDSAKARVLVLPVLLGVLVTLLGPEAHPATSDRTIGVAPVTWRDVVPCGATCPQVTGPTIGSGPFKSDWRQYACDQTPFGAIPGSWQDKTVIVPSKVAGLKPVGVYLEARPQIDWDIFVCLATSGGYKYVNDGALPQNECSLAFAYGCVETARAAVAPGQRIILRAWNRSDGVNFAVTPPSGPSIPPPPTFDPSLDLTASMAWVVMVPPVRVTLTLKPTTITLGKVATFSGLVSPKHAGKQVRLELISASTWVLLRSAKLSRTSTYILTWKPVRRGNYILRVRFPTQDGDHSEGISRNVTLVVR